MGIPYLTSPPKKYDDIPMTDFTDTIDNIRRWSGELNEQIGPLGWTTYGLNDDGRAMTSIATISCHIGSMVNSKHVFQVPANLHNECNSLTKEMTGEPFVTSTYLLMVNQGVWWEIIRSPTTGSGIGFTLRGLDLDTVASEEQGVRDAD